MLFPPLLHQRLFPEMLDFEEGEAGRELLGSLTFSAASFSLVICEVIRRGKGKNRYYSENSTVSGREQGRSSSVFPKIMRKVNRTEADENRPLLCFRGTAEDQPGTHKTYNTDTFSTSTIKAPLSLACRSENQSSGRGPNLPDILAVSSLAF